MVKWTRQIEHSEWLSNSLLHRNNFPTATITTIQTTNFSLCKHIIFHSVSEIVSYCSALHFFPLHDATII